MCWARRPRSARCCSARTRPSWSRWPPARPPTSASRSAGPRCWPASSRRGRRSSRAPPRDWPSPPSTSASSAATAVWPPSAGYRPGRNWLTMSPTASAWWPFSASFEGLLPELRHPGGDDPFVAPLHQRPAEDGAGSKQRIPDLDRPGQMGGRRRLVAAGYLELGGAFDVAAHVDLDQLGRYQPAHSDGEPERVRQRGPNFAFGAAALDQAVALEPAEPGPPTAVVV